MSGKFDYEPGDLAVPQCVLCRRLIRGRAGACEAFPGGIPPEIRENAYDHRRPYRDPASGRVADTGMVGDQSLLFAPCDDAHPGAVAAVERALDALRPA